MMKQVNSTFLELSQPRFPNTKPAEFSNTNNRATIESDDFRMYAFKIKRCSKTRPHDWMECPYAHRGEKARRRDPRKINYMGIACPEFRRGACCKGESCEFAHGVFEFWLHPARYRTRACKAGKYCRRKVCFFAHTPEQLRTGIKYDNLYRAVSNGGHKIVSPGKESLSSGDWDVLDRMGSLKIDAADLGSGDRSDSPDIDWIWELVE